MTLKDYLVQSLVRDAVERNFISLGEIVDRIAKEDPETLNAISNSRETLGLRHRIAYGYGPEINDTTIWMTIQHSVPVLMTELKALLAMD